VAWRLVTGTITRPAEITVIKVLDAAWMEEQAKEQAAAARARKTVKR
jgi:hypothetical protein